MGVYGGSSQASMNGNPADFDVSGNVDIDDLSELVDLWLEDVSSDFHDLSGNGRIDLEDFEHLSRQWAWKR